MDRSDFSIQDRGEATLAPPGAIRLPLVSFVLTRQPGDDFARVIEAMRMQTYPRFEAILVDAGATASSRTTLEHLIDGDPRFKTVSVDTDPGRFSRASLGLAAADGEFVTFLEATEIPLPSFTAVHIQAHLASRHNVAFTASSISTDEPARGGLPPASPAPAPAAAWLQPETPVLRLSCLADDAFADLASRTTLIEPPRLGWSASPDAAQMYRRFIIDLLDPGAGASTEQPSSPAALYAPLCQLLGGSAGIGMPLSRRLPGAVPEPTDEDLAGGPVADHRLRLRVWAANGSDFARRIGAQRYWDGLTLLLGGLPPGSGEVPSPSQIAERTDGLLPLLVRAFGERRAIHRLDSQLPRPAVLAILRKHHGAGLPLRVHFALHTTVLRQMNERLRQHLRARKAKRRQS
ncbi:glycosyltransferase family 2 protein [Kaistia sp. UC242_56]|uniref:glycosyltransferase family 2 protein n=1 Tax=Kaistia sp. UC242_56 TaxID=3374625 RepID=UPI00379C81E2